MRNRIIISLIFLSIVSISGAQERDSSLTGREMRKQRPRYIEIGLGASLSSFRDLATSPLGYRSVSSILSLAYLRQDSRRETKYNLRIISGKFTARFNDVGTQSSVALIDLSFSKMYAINKISNEKWNFKAGVLADIAADTRVNGSLQNNSLGIDLFFNIMGSGKITRDISRETVKQKTFLWIKYNLQPRKRNLAFRMNLGLFNSHYRNPYVYAGQSAVVNKLAILDGYEYKVFSGLRFSTELNYTIYLKNKNALMLSYIWDSYRTGGDLDQFGVAIHILKFSLLFNTK